VFFLPYVTNSIAIGMVFNVMFTQVGAAISFKQPEYINNILGFFGTEPVNWVNPGSTWTANMIVVCSYIVWNALPFKILVLLGGLQTVNKQYYQAAKIDGTSKSRTFMRITVPLLSPMIAMLLLLLSSADSKIFKHCWYLWSKHGPHGQMNTIVGYVYDMLPKSNTEMLPQLHSFSLHHLACHSPQLLCQQ
jgi:multiple sugar transport system permease protein